MASALLSYVIDNHIELQTDEEFLDKTVRDGTIMIPALEKEMKDKLKEFPPEHSGDVDYWKYRQSLYPTYIEIVKKMYEEYLENS